MREISYVPYLVGIIFFVVTYFLVTKPVSSYILLDTGSEFWAAITVSIILGALGFIVVGYIQMQPTAGAVPQ